MTYLDGNVVRDRHGKAVGMKDSAFGPARKIGIREATRIDTYRQPSVLERDPGVQWVASSSVTLSFSDPVDDSFA
jgi:hypothetical protein